MTKRRIAVLLLSCSILMACSNLPAIADSDPWAQIKLADIYLNGRGVPANPVEAAKLYALAADSGNPMRRHGSARSMQTGPAWTRT
jgi:TPR repeat protein